MKDVRSAFAWTFTGNALYAAAQWAILSLIAKLGGADMLGQYALAVALTTPVVMLSHLNLRAVLATDVEGRYPFGDYLAVRLGATALSLAAIAILALVFGGSGPLAATILVTGLWQSLDTVSDIYYGAMQRRDEMSRVGRSMTVRGLASASVFGIVLWMARDLVWALVAMTAVRLVVLAAYDRPRGAAGERLSRSGWPAGRSILGNALPLGLVLMLVSLNTNLPRYAIERYLGVGELGVFAAVASFMTVGSTMVNALGQAAAPQLVVYFSRGESKEFRMLARMLTKWVFALGVAGVVVAAIFGELVLRLIYRPEYAVHSRLLVAFMGAAMAGYVAIALGYVITSTRVFNAQAVLFCGVAAGCGLASWLLVPRFGLHGAVLALALAAIVQISGQVLILVAVVRRMEATA